MISKRANTHTHTHSLLLLRHLPPYLPSSILMVQPAAAAAADAQTLAVISRPGAARVFFSSQTYTVENKTHLCFSSWPSSVWLLVMASVFNLPSSLPADL